MWSFVPFKERYNWSKSLSSLLNPFFVFSAVQCVPLLLWLFLPPSEIQLIIRGAEVPDLRVASLMMFILMLLSFGLGSFLGQYVSISKRDGSKGFRNSILTHEVDFSRYYNLKYLMYCSLFFSLISVLYIFIILGFGFQDIIKVWANSQGNTIKELVYGKGGLTSLIIMPRHLIIIAFISLCVLHRAGYKNKIVAFLVIFLGLSIFIFTSSRLTAISIVVAYFLISIDREKLDSLFFLNGLVFIICLIGLFILWVIYRSAGTWEAVSGSDNLVVAGFYELAAYLISPINYSIAIIEKGLTFDYGNILAFSFPVAFTLFDINVGFQPDDYIGVFYSPSLTQIGILGQWYSGYGPILIIPFAIYGWLCGAVYKSFMRAKVLGLLFYPLVVVSLLDSFRGFLLFQNIIFANIIFFLGFLAINKFFHALCERVNSKN